MDETIATRAGNRQRAHDGLRTFFDGGRGAHSVDGTTSARRATAEPRSPTDVEIREAGRTFLDAAFGHDDDEGFERVDAVAATPIDNAWVLRRIAKLRPMADGPARLIPKVIWNLATALSQPDWFHTWRLLARRCPRDWLEQFCGVALLDAEHELKPLDSRRVQSMLSLGLLAWHLCEFDPSDRNYPYVIRGLPYGAWQHLVAYWRQWAYGWDLHVPSSTTLFGTHGKRDGRWFQADCGYLTAWRQTAIAKISQPNGFQAAPGLAGKWRKNKDGQWERWAFIEVRLRISAPGIEPVPMGPPAYALHRCPPPLAAASELQALVDRVEDEWPPPALQRTPTDVSEALVRSEGVHANEGADASSASTQALGMQPSASIPNYADDPKAITFDEAQVADGVDDAGRSFLATLARYRADREQQARAKSGRSPPKQRPSG
jgi:hypothetical protein